MSKLVELEGSRLHNFLHFQRDPLGFMVHILAKGDIVSLRSSRKNPSFALNDPEVIREVLILKDSSFRKGRSSQIFKATLGQGVVTSEGEQHDRQRQMILPAFQKQRIQEYSKTVIKQTSLALDEWQIGEERPLHQDIMRLTLSIIIEAMFGVDRKEDAEKLGNAVEETINYTANRIFSPIPLPKFIPTRGNLRHTRSMRVLHAAAQQFIQEGQSSSAFLRSILHRGEVKEPEVIDQMITMLIAGHETTANALCWSWYLLTQHPQIEKNWREEIDQVLGDRLPTYEDLSKLSYTNQIWQEVLRLYPPAWMVLREANDEVKIGGHIFKPNSIFMICPYSLHRNPRDFEHSEQFIPERFASSSSKDIPRYAYLPFGAGARSCIGNQFATMEACLILVLMAQRFRLELVSGQFPLIPEPSVSLRIKGGLRMKVMAR